MYRSITYDDIQDFHIITLHKMLFIETSYYPVTCIFLTEQRYDFIKENNKNANSLYIL